VAGDLPSKQIELIHEFFGFPRQAHHPGQLMERSLVLRRRRARRTGRSRLPCTELYHSAKKLSSARQQRTSQRTGIAHFHELGSFLAS
jgi:hypothetical protein